MNKISILGVSFALAVAFSSCETSRDDNPVLPAFDKELESDYLNEPVMQNQYIDITEDGAGGYLQLTCSQPKEYGYAASVRYYPLVSLTRDFADYRQLDGDWSTLCSNISISTGSLAEAVCELLGVRQESDLPQGYYPIYVRLKADVYTDLGIIVPNTTVLSNVVEYKHVRVSYLAIVVPDQPSVYYLRGSWSESWDAMPEYNFLTTDEKNVWRIANVTLAAGTSFKVADANWGAVNLGSGAESSDVIEVGTPYTLLSDSNSGNINLNEAFTGSATLTLKDGVYTLLLTPAN